MTTQDPFDLDSLKITATEMVELANAANMWRDEHFGYDMDFDFFAERKDIVRHDGVKLYSVPTINSGAWYSVHFCLNAAEIWAVDLRKLADIIEYERRYVSYSPRRRKEGPPTARGYCIPCDVVLEAGHKWTMPPRLVERMEKSGNKKDVGLLTEKAFAWLVNTQKFFVEIFVGEATKASYNDDYRNGVDFWINKQIPVQVKFDGPGGQRGTGNLFFQTHTMSAKRAEEWHNYQRGA